MEIADHMSLGGLGDSFYEYLLKAWIQSGKEDVEAREMYDEAVAAITEYMIKTSPGKLVYVSDLKYDRLEHKMGHLACFAGKLYDMQCNYYNYFYFVIIEFKYDINKYIYLSNIFCFHTLIHYYLNLDMTLITKIIYSTYFITTRQFLVILIHL